MPVYLFTFHAFMSWLPDRKRGYVEPGKGILPQDFDRAREYRESATHPAIDFDQADAWTMIGEAALLSGAEQWILYEAAVTSTHIHLLVGWRGDVKYPIVSRRFKQRLGPAISKAKNRCGPWFSRGGSRKRVRDRRHFDYLLKTYLPRHGPLRYSLRMQRRD